MEHLPDVILFSSQGCLNKFPFSHIEMKFLAIKLSFNHLMSKRKVEQELNKISHKNPQDWWRSSRTGGAVSRTGGAVAGLVAQFSRTGGTVWQDW